MRKHVLAALFMLVLAGCNTAGNMAHEVGGWFNDKKTVAEAPAPAAAPLTPVEAAPLATTPSAPPRAVKVGLILPLSGDKASLGKSFLDAAQLAVLDLGGEAFDLIPRDGGADAATAGKAAEDVLNEGATLIIGPLFSDAVPAVRNAASARRVPVLTLSNDVQVAGGGTYVLGFSPAEQLQRLAEFAAARGITNIAVLAPSSSYGELALKALQEAGGLTIVAHEIYNANKESIRKAVAALATRKDELQGIIIPDGGVALAGVAEALQAAGISAKTLPLMGTGLWDDPLVSRQPALLGGWFAAPEPTRARSAFTARFQKNYGYKPVRLASLAYDATALAAVLTRKGQNFDEAALTSSSGFAGLDGTFRLLSDGRSQHGLAIMEVTPSGPRVIDAAPVRF